MDKNCFAPFPPMGWNSYDYYDTTVTEEQVKANADYMAAHLKEYGWTYVIVDIQWYAHNAGTRRKEFQYIPFSELEMDKYSRLLPDPERFPSSKGGKGFAPLADYIHGLGLKFGIHIMRGVPRQAAHRHTALWGNTLTADEIADPSSICGWNPDMYGVRDTEAGQAYYDSLIGLYAGWGVDYIKCDDICNTSIYPRNPYSARHEVEMLSRAIQRSGREIVLSLSPGPALIEQAWHYETYANMWRITDDFWDTWKHLLAMFGRCELWQNHVSKGCYPDCDMLPLGRIGKGFGDERRTRFTRDEAKTMMTLWCVFGSPLMLGCELTKLDGETLGLITNRELFRLLDPAFQRRQLMRDDRQAVWTSLSPDGCECYLALFNLSEQASDVTVSPELMSQVFRGCEKTGTETLRELWSGSTLPVPESALSVTLPPHGCSIFRYDKSVSISSDACAEKSNPPC